MGRLKDKLELIQNARVGILRTRISDGLILLANNWIAQFLGYESAEEVIGRVHTCAHYIKPELRRQLLDAFTGNEICDYHLKLKRTDGRIVWLSYSGLMFPEKDYIDGCMIDITSRYEMEQVMKENDAFHRTLFNNSYSIILIIDAQTGEILTANPTAVAFYGYSMDVLKTMTIDQLAMISRAELPKLLARATEAGSIEYCQHRTFSGELKDIESRWRLVYINGQKMILVINNDITERKRWEKTLCESEQRLADIFDFLPDPTLVIDKEGKVLAWNRAIEDMTGVPASEMLGKGDYEYAIPFYGVRQPILIDLVFANNPEVEKTYSFIQRDKEAIVAETPTPCVKGQRRFLWGKATPLYNSQGEVVGAIESIRDVTQRREYEEALQESYNRLEKILEGIVEALVATAEKRDPYTAGHQRRVARLAIGIAKAMGLPEQLQNIQIAASLHDIGKIYIPAEILSKPGELTEIERMMVESHPQAGFDIVKSIPFTEPIASILMQHHERIDGSGYPQGLKGEEILLEAKIIAVADVVEAMSSHRPYRPAFGVDKALNEIVKNRGCLYEPRVVDACVRMFMKTGFILE